MKAMHGVNLGGWFIPERWMSPSLFAASDTADLYHLLLAGGQEEYSRHLDTWVTEDDFRWLAAHGIEIVRLPVGYWAVNPDEIYPDVSSKLAWAFTMAEKYKIKVLLDFHGLKGSQNGKDHSGQLGGVNAWQYKTENLASLLKMASTYSASSAFWGIELVNEPHVGRNYFALLRWYRQAYKALKSVLPKGKITVFHDGFMPIIFTHALRSSKDYPVMMDMHLYGLPAWFARSDMHYRRFQWLVFNIMIRLSKLGQPVLIGEWSSVLPQRLFDQYPEPEHGKLLAENIARQQTLYSETEAVFYWNYKAEAGGMWNYRSLVEQGVVVL